MSAVRPPLNMHAVLRHRGLAYPYRIQPYRVGLRPCARWNSTSVDKPARPADDLPPPPPYTPETIQQQREREASSKPKLTDPAPRPAPAPSQKAAPPPPPPSASSPSKSTSTTSTQAQPSQSTTASSTAAQTDSSKSTSTFSTTATSSTTSASTSVGPLEHSDIAARERPSAISPSEPFLPRAWAWLKHEAHHYYSGSKLLAKEVRISARLVRKLVGGAKLTRREHRQLKRTTTDLLRLIPFSVFVIVPFMEILLPVALKLFPNMLPSTFEDKFAAEEKQRKLLRVRLEMAKFLQETLRESGMKGAAKVTDSEEFGEFFRKVRSTGETPSTEDIIRVAKLFNDDLTLDNLSRPQLVGMCRYMNVNAFGTDNFLRYVIRQRIASIKRDDQWIHTEGVDSLSTKELQQACRERAVRTVGVSPARLREELEQWIELHLTNNISGTLLILSRAFSFGEQGDHVVKSLETTLSSMPDHLINETELEVSGDRGSYAQKLEVLQQQEELIEDEAEQEQEEETARRKKKELEERQKREKEAVMAQALLPDSELQEGEDDARMTTEQLGELGEALSILSAKSSVLKERDELKALMEETTPPAEPEEGEKPLSSEDRASLSLSKKIRSMLTKIDGQLQAYDAKVGSSLQMISCTAQGMIPVADLQRALKVIKHAPGEEVIEKLVGKLDVDKDGFVVLEHVLELAREEGLGIVVDDDAKDLIGQGKELKDSKPRKEDIVQE